MATLKPSATGSFTLTAKAPNGASGTLPIKVI
jgi:hypothetical protein